MPLLVANSNDGRITCRLRDIFVRTEVKNDHFRLL